MNLLETLFNSQGGETVKSIANAAGLGEGDTKRIMENRQVGEEWAWWSTNGKNMLYNIFNVMQSIAQTFAQQGRLQAIDIQVISSEVCNYQNTN